MDTYTLLWLGLISFWLIAVYFTNGSEAKENPQVELKDIPKKKELKTQSNIPYVLYIVLYVLAYFLTISTFAAFQGKDWAGESGYYLYLLLTFATFKDSKSKIRSISIFIALCVLVVVPLHIGNNTTGHIFPDILWLVLKYVAIIGIYHILIAIAEGIIKINLPICKKINLIKNNISFSNLFLNFIQVSYIGFVGLVLLFPPAYTKYPETFFSKLTFVSELEKIDIYLFMYEIISIMIIGALIYWVTKEVRYKKIDAAAKQRISDIINKTM